MNKYERLQADLKEKGWGKMKCFGNSMLPILDSASMTYFIVQDDYKVGDIVFCRVKGRFIDSHLITQKDAKKGFMISNNHGWQNGWCKKIFGRVIKSVNNSGKEKYFDFTEEQFKKLTKEKEVI
jgi:hypothetical protein